MRCSVPLLVFGALALASLASAKPVKLGLITQLVNFGDSLTDNGNGSYLLTNKTWPADPAYFNGRFSNGPTGGLNDIFFAIGTPVFESPEKFAEGSAKRLMQAVEVLRKAGAINFIIPYGPKLDTLPYTSTTSPSVQASFSAYSKALHLAVQKHAKAYLRAHPLLHIVLFDGDVDSTLGGAEAFKVTDKPCLVGAYGEAPRSLCAEPDQYLFWDLYHPTTRAHSFLAQKAFKAIKRAA
ncbi:lipolytic protein g-d-s-l family [Ceraceosorus bombacis]|uniref:Lipolytic protein g-d-s-l family n=1 Tax=Ceraceosorus bombacis TaxID=401625 RepID=A0A0P1BFQ3_9BASI|nr:lipolytic protein g-d-s-l family [Ceraceosorus bombacis]